MTDTHSAFKTTCFYNLGPKQRDYVVAMRISQHDMKQIVIELQSVASDVPLVLQNMRQTEVLWDKRFPLG